MGYVTPANQANVFIIDISLRFSNLPIGIQPDALCLHFQPYSFLCSYQLWLATCTLIVHLVILNLNYDPLLLLENKAPFFQQVYCLLLTSNKSELA